MATAGGAARGGDRGPARDQGELVIDCGQRAGRKAHVPGQVWREQLSTLHAWVVLRWARPDVVIRLQADPS